MIAISRTTQWLWSGVKWSGRKVLAGHMRVTCTEAKVDAAIYTDPPTAQDAAREAFSAGWQAQLSLVVSYVALGLALLSTTGAEREAVILDSGEEVMVLTPIWALHLFGTAFLLLPLTIPIVYLVVYRKHRMEAVGLVARNAATLPAAVSIIGLSSDLANRVAIGVGVVLLVPTAFQLVRTDSIPGGSVWTAAVPAMVLVALSGVTVGRCRKVRQRGLEALHAGGIPSATARYNRCQYLRAWLLSLESSFGYGHPS